MHRPPGGRGEGIRCNNDTKSTFVDCWPWSSRVVRARGQHRWERERIPAHHPTLARNGQVLYPSIRLYG